jgi:hypothetical protein
VPWDTPWYCSSTIPVVLLLLLLPLELLLLR